MLNPVAAAVKAATPYSPGEARKWAATALSACRQGVGHSLPLWTVLAVARAIGLPNRIDRAMLPMVSGRANPAIPVTMQCELVHSLLRYEARKGEAKPLPMPKGPVKWQA